MIIILLGSPGSGKGSISELLVSKYKFFHISTGNIFRKLKQANNTGTLISDEITNNLLKSELEKDIYKKENKKIILDGYPRTINQAKFLDTFAKISYVIYIDAIDDKDIINRLSKRWLCKENNHIFNENKISELKNFKCMHDGSELYQRLDDKPEVIKKRLKIYNEQTYPLIEVYEKQNKLIKINGNKSIDAICNEILDITKN